MFEKSIARSFQNKGLMLKAVEHYDKALACIGFGHKTAAGNIMEAALGFMSIVLFLYLPFARSRKKPSDDEIEIMRIAFDRA